MRFVFHPEALNDLLGASQRYKRVSPQLAMEFLDEIEHGVKCILASPSAWALYRGEARRHLIRRFPFGIVYKLRETEIVVIAIAHSHRDPDYWKDRKID